MMPISLANFTPPRVIDIKLLIPVLMLLSLGVVMVASSSLDFANARYQDPWFFVKKQSVYLLLGMSLATLVASVPLAIWQKFSTFFLLLAIAVLLVVLVPGIGKVVNGSRRWLQLGPVSMQASELAKICLVIYFSSYLARKNIEVRERWSGFVKMVAIIAIVVFLLLIEPDFGSSVVICMSLGAMMFVAGVPIVRFLMLAASGLGFLILMAVVSPYRWERLVSFMDPWSRQFDSGYQLVQSLIAFGRGEWLGLGLGNSLQKLFFLPEAHTDFIFAIYAEEFGLIGALVLIGIYAYLINQMVLLAKRAYIGGNLFGSFLVFGIAVMFAVQAFINMGVASGLLPTKGLTLPFISYGGSSLLICCALAALVFRVSWEERGRDD